MTEEDLEFENELKALRPRTPSEAALRDLGRAVGAGGTDRGSETFLLRRWIGWGCAATFLLGLGTLTLRPELALPPGEHTAASRIQPLNTETVVIGAEDEGVITLPDGTTARRYRIRAVDTFTWRNQATRATLRWSVPREDIRIVPVNYF